MKNNNLINVTEDHFQAVIKKSWTWQRLTEEEKANFINLNFDNIKGTKKQRLLLLNDIYKAFLAGLGYKPIGWREPNRNWTSKKINFNLARTGEVTGIFGGVVCL